MQIEDNAPFRCVTFLRLRTSCKIHYPVVCTPFRRVRHNADVFLGLRDVDSGFYNAHSLLELEF
jgi:hypothetical protein